VEVVEAELGWMTEVTVRTVERVLLRVEPSVVYVISWSDVVVKTVVTGPVAADVVPDCVPEAVFEPD
jgi:hypothetical protein